MSNPHLLVIGHWMYDQIIILPDNLDLTQPIPPEHIHSPVISCPGGSGFHFSTAAKRAGFSYVTAVICHGSDLLSKHLLKIAYDSKINILHFETGDECAQAVLLYDKRNRRVSFGHRGPNLHLPETVLNNIEFNDYDYIFVAGHVLEEPSAGPSVLQLLKSAHNSRAFIVLDLVPHHLSRIVPKSYIRQIVPFIDGIVSYRLTLINTLGFLSSKANENDKLFLFDLLNNFDWICMHPNNEEVLIAKKIEGQADIYKTKSNYQSKEIKAGSLDEVVAKEFFLYSQQRNDVNIC